jgi:hypothetical protein
MEAAGAKAVPQRGVAPLREIAPGAEIRVEVAGDAEIET